MDHHRTLEPNPSSISHLACPCTHYSTWSRPHTHDSPALHIPGSPTQLYPFQGLCPTLAPSLHSTLAYPQFYTHPNPAPCSPDLSSVPPRRMRQLVNWSTGAHAAHCPLRIVSRAEPSKLWAQAGSARSRGNRKSGQAIPRDSQLKGLSRGCQDHVTTT